MKFEEALQAMRKGKKVRRKAWGEETYITIAIFDDCLHSGERILITQFGNPVSLNTAILKNDWEIVDD